MGRIDDLIADMRALGVLFWLEDDDVCIEDALERLDDAGWARIRTHLPGIKAHLAARAAARTDEPTSPEQQGGLCPMSPCQEGMWAQEQLAPVGPANSITAVFRGQGRLDYERVEAAVAALVRRHEPLRTRFVCVNGEGMQQIDPFEGDRPHLVSRVDVSGLDRSRAESIAEQRRRAFEEAAFDLAKGPLFRVQMIRVAADEHLLVLAMHHLIADGWSLSVMIKELGQVYDALTWGETPSLPPLPLRYRDYAVWRRGRSDEAQRRFWTRTLADLGETSLWTDRPRPATVSYAGDRVRLAISSDVCAALADLARAEGATLFMVLLAAFQLLLARWTGEDEVVVGCPIADRPDQQLEGLVGFLVNTLVMRAQVSLAADFSTLVQQVRSMALDAQANADASFDRVVADLRRERDPSRHPLFQILFAWQNFPSAPLQMEGMRWSGLEPARSGSQFDVALHLGPDGDEICGHFEYATALFDRASIESLAQAFTILLQGLTSQPRQPVGRQPLLAPTGRRRVLLQAASASPASPPACLQDRLIAQMARTPDAVAVVCGQTSLTYAQLDQRSAALAARLVGCGVGAERVVGVAMERTVGLVVALLAVLRTGGAYLPLDPQYPAERLRFMVTDSAAAMVITTSALAETLPLAAAAALLMVDADGCCGDADPPAPLSRAHVEPQNAAYVLYTSGSTGLPKGVCLAHGASALIEWAIETFDRNVLDGVIAGTSICFDLSVFELFLPLSAGGAVLLAPNSVTVPQARSTMINTVPAAVADLLERQAVPSSVSVINIAGEPLGLHLVQDLYRLDHVKAVYNLYGPTETTTYSTFAKLPRDLRAAPPIGAPIAGGQVYLLDEELEPVPQGAVGEVYIAGRGLARGYVANPAMTAERFIPNPFGDGQRMYRTGDLARRGGDGDLYYLGRRDSQVKLRGFRIELGEIEAQMLTHPLIRAAAAKVDTAGTGILAYVVLREAGRLTLDEIRSHLQMRLPQFMLPSRLVLLHAMPQTRSGKIDRRALPDAEVLEKQIEATSPCSALENEVLTIWRSIMGQNIGLHGNFFAVGGHSLMAMRIVSKIQNDLQIELPLVAIFRAPTVALLCQDWVAPALMRAADMSSIGYEEGVL